jgi:hypothetical protein
MRTFSFSFHWPPSGDRLFFSLKGRSLIILAFSFPNIIFNSNLEKTCSHNLIGKKMNEQSLVHGKNKESRLEGCNSLERMEVGRDDVGSLKS